MNQAIPSAVEKAVDAIDSIPFASWPSREIQGIACELTGSLVHEYNSHARLEVLLSVNARLSKAIADAYKAERTSLSTSASRVVYYATGKVMLDADMPELENNLRLSGDALELRLQSEAKTS